MQGCSIKSLIKSCKDYKTSAVNVLPMGQTVQMTQDAAQA